MHVYRVAQSKPLPHYQKIVLLKPVNEIRYILQIKMSVKHYIIFSVGTKYDLFCDDNICLSHLSVGETSDLIPRPLDHKSDAEPHVDLSGAGARGRWNVNGAGSGKFCRSAGAHIL